MLSRTPVEHDMNYDEQLGSISREKFHKLYTVVATSIVLIARKHIKIAFAFDHHFTSAGFELVGQTGDNSRVCARIKP